jgi:hypothetical protein
MRHEGTWGIKGNLGGEKKEGLEAFSLASDKERGWKGWMGRPRWWTS